ncbi:hypothetical protein B0H12DRAFT_1256758 [Mycena haematopus]|nr:hypothetical protein B0H12DRAFT_1256758 [Mycena haematopus]
MFDSIGRQPAAYRSMICGTEYAKIRSNPAMQTLKSRLAVKRSEKKEFRKRTRPWVGIPSLLPTQQPSPTLFRLSESETSVVASMRRNVGNATQWDTIPEQRRALPASVKAQTHFRAREGVMKANWCRVQLF